MIKPYRIVRLDRDGEVRYGIEYRANYPEVWTNTTDTYPTITEALTVCDALNERDDTIPSKEVRYP